MNPATKPLTRHDVEHMEQRDQCRYEFINGQAYAMTGSTLAHNMIVNALRDVLKPQVKPCIVTTESVGADMADDVSYTYPDVMVVCNPTIDRRQQHPVLLAEVLSDSTAKRDRIDKLAAYRAIPSCQIYLIVHQHDRRIECYRRLSDWKREDFIDGVIRLNQPDVYIDLVIDLSDVYAEVIEHGYLQ